MMNLRTAVMAIASLGAIGLAANSALAQAATRAVFVANNGNLEGSVTAFRVNEDGTVTFVNRIVTGTRTTLTQPCSGCNATAITITPAGEFLASSHAAGDPPLPDGLTIFRVNADASITQVLHVPLVSLPSPLDVQWLDDQHLAVTRTSNPGNGVAVYRFDPLARGGPTLTQIDVELGGGFTTGLAIDPNGDYLYAQNSSGGNGVFIHQINADGTLTNTGFFSTAPVLPLGPCVSPNNHWFYAGGGISSGSHAVLGAEINPDTGGLSLIDGSPFVSEGNSPKQVVVSSVALLAFAAHGSDSSVRSFDIDPITGGLAATGFSFAMGIQGSLGEIAVLDNLIFACDRDTISDGVRGLISRTVGFDGSMTANGPIVDTQGISPNGLAVWGPSPFSAADINQDGVVDGVDLGLLLVMWNAVDESPADLNNDAIVDGVDLGILLASWTL